VIINWVEGEKRKVASKPLKGEWAFNDKGDFSLGLETLNREKKRKTPPKRTIQPLANAIDAPTSSVLSGGQIGFAAGTAAPSNGLVVSGIAGFGFSAIVNDVALPVQINAAAATERYFGADKAGTYGLLVGYTNGAFLGLTGAVIRNVPADPIYIYVNSNTQAMQITSAARVGLSCTPLNRLDVSGSVAIGTFAGVNTAPSNGLIVSGQSIFKATSSFIGGSVEIQGSDRISFGIGGTKTSTDGSVQTGIYLGPTYSPTANTSIATNILSFPTFSPPMGVTITNAAHVRLQTGAQAGAGAVTNGYNLYVENAGFGTNRYCAYLAGPVGIGTLTPQNRLDVSGAVAIGSYAGVNTAPSNGLIVSGQVGIGTTTTGNGFVSISPSTSNLYGLVVGGAVRGISGTDDALGNVLAVTLTGPTAGATNAVELYVNPLFTAGAGTVNTMYGCFINAGTITTNPTTGYGLFVSQPVYGATAYAASIQGGMVHKVTNVTDDYTITTADYYVVYDGVDPTDVLSLPDPLPVAGWTCVIKLVPVVGSMVTVSGNGHDIDGAPNVALTFPGTSVLRVFSNGVDYSIW
jgi:hypothetical protein